MNEQFSSSNSYTFYIAGVGAISDLTDLTPGEREDNKW